MANRFNTIQGNREDFQSLFVPMPLDAITNLAKDYSDKYKAGQALPSEFDAFASTVKYAPIHQNLAQSWMQDANKEIGEIVNNAKETDWADYNFQRKIQNTVNKYKYDDRLNTIRNTYDYWSKEGEKVLNNQDYQSGIQLDKFKDRQGNWIQTDKSVQDIQYYKPQDHIKPIKELMDKPEAYGDTSGSGIQKDGQGYFIIKDNKREYITEGQIKRIAESNLDNYVNSEGGQYRFKKMLEQSGFDPRMNYNDFISDDRIPIETKLRAKEIMLSDLTGYGSKYIHTKTSGNTSMKNDVMSLKKQLDEEKNKAEFAALGKIEGSANTIPVTTGQALTNIGVRHANENGDIDYSFIAGSPDKVKKDFEKLRSRYEKGELTADAYITELKNIGIMHEASIGNQKKANEYYSDMVTAANNLGFNIEDYRGKDLKVNYTKLKDDLAKYSKNVLKESSNIDAFQTKFKEDLSNNYFGKYDSKSDTWSVAPLTDNMKVYPQGNPNESKDYVLNENKKELAKTASFIGFDFNDPNLGALSFVASKDDKSNIYNGIVPDQTIKTLMAPMHRFTQEYKQASNGKFSQAQSDANKKYVQDEILQLTNHLYQSGDPNFEVKMKTLNDLQSAVSNSPGRIIAAVSSDRSKFYIGTVGRDENQKPTKKAFVLDVKTGTVTEEPIDLGKFQQEESAKIQQIIAPGYNKQSEGYDPNNIIFSE